MPFTQKVELYSREGKISSRYAEILSSFYKSYTSAIAGNDNGNKLDMAQLASLLDVFIEAVAHQIAHPHPFESFHQRTTEPVDYYSFGIELFRPVIDIDRCQLLGLDNVQKMVALAAKKENIILLSNHQTELDPQVISILLEKSYPDFAADMIFVAGSRVLTDPMAIPFSLGRNLLCIHSKRHIESDPALKTERQQHNQRTMNRMRELLNEGGKAIYVAPSGGRDRPNSDGIIEVAPLDPQSIELFQLIASKAEHPTHFFPLALASYNLLPPPDDVQKDLGEPRRTKITPVHAAFGAEITMDRFPGCDQPDKKLKRQARADHIWSLIDNDYQRLIGKL